MLVDNSLKSILNAVAEKKLSPDQAAEQIKKHMLINVDDIVQFDLYRGNRSGIPEVIYAEKKTPRVCVEIIEQIVPKSQVVLFTRLTIEQIETFKDKYINTNTKFNLDLDELGRVAIVSLKKYIFPKLNSGKVGIITAGTSDVPVAKEAESVLRLMGISMFNSYDIGVAGLHRLIEPLKMMLSKENVDVIIVIAGMEGALPSIIAGLVDVPVIAVPTSVQSSGIRPGGEVALFGMLTSCSPGMAVVNIDAGFSAGAIAGLIAKRCHDVIRSGLE